MLLADEIKSGQSKPILFFSFSNVESVKLSPKMS